MLPALRHAPNMSAERARVVHATSSPGLDAARLLPCTIKARKRAKVPLHSHYNADACRCVAEKQRLGGNI